MQTEIVKGKKEWIEALRVYCILAVLVDHVIITALHLYASSATVTERFGSAAVIGLSRFAVPVFVMITGYLLLCPDKEIGYRKALGKYAWRMVAILLTVGTAFAWMETCSTEKTFSLGQLPMAFLQVLRGKTWTHMWYLYMLIGLYLVLPVLKAAVASLSKRELDVFILIGFLFTSVCPMLSHFFGFELGVKFPVASIYVFYLLLGYRLGTVPVPAHGEAERKGWVPLVALVGAVLVGLAWLEHAGGYETLSKLSTYGSPLLLLLSATVFRMGMSTGGCHLHLLKRLGGVMLARDSFGIYVFHMLWINIIYKVLHLNPYDKGLWLLLPVLLVVLVLSGLTTIAFRKLPWLGKYI